MSKTRRTSKPSADARKAVAYLRVSTEDQHLGPEAQRAAVVAWATRAGVEIVAWYEDKGVSGAAAIDRRPGLLAALDALAEHGAGLLVVAKRDRLARDVVAAAMIERMAERAGARVTSAAGEGEGDDPASKLMRTMIDAFAEYERAIIKARISAALAVKAARGEKVGGVQTYGKADGIDAERAATERAILDCVRELRAAGLDDFNTIATEAIERVAGERFDADRANVKASPLFWWAGSATVGYELRFTRALAQVLHRRNRKLRPGMMMPLATMILRSGVERPELASDGRLQHRADDGTTRAAAAQMHLAERALGETAPPGVVPLAAYLATVCFEQRRRGQDEAQARRVVIPSMSRDVLRRFGIETPAELRAALEWLRSLSIGDPRFDLWTCVTGYAAEGPRPSASTTGGRPPKPGYVVEVGYPLAPFAANRLADTFTAHGMAPPPSLGFYFPVLSVEAAPGPAPRSYGPTHRRQLDAYCMALPLVLAEKREEYAERGIKLGDLRAPLRAVGIYHRSNTSLFDNLCDVWTAAPQPDLFGHRNEPVLVPVESGSDRYRLGPDYADADGMIVDAAGFTEQKRRAGAKGRSVAMLQRTKGPR